jgi:acyl-coenzyme A synthetase/AMP-(fatty) acid ligase
MNPIVSATYLNVPDPIRDVEGWVNTGDLAEIVGDRVYFRGRANGMINVGGDKVVPEEVEQVLLSHPAVAAARVYALPSPIVGSLIAADIVLCAEADRKQDIRQVLKIHCSTKLPRYKVPMNFKIVPGFDVGTTGKIRRTNAA